MLVIHILLVRLQLVGTLDHRGRFSLLCFRASHDNTRGLRQDFEGLPFLRGCLPQRGLRIPHLTQLRFVLLVPGLENTKEVFRGSRILEPLAGIGPISVLRDEDFEVPDDVARLWHDPGSHIGRPTCDTTCCRHVHTWVPAWTSREWGNRTAGHPPN